MSKKRLYLISLVLIPLVFLVFFVSYAIASNFGIQQENKVLSENVLQEVSSNLTSLVQKIDLRGDYHLASFSLDTTDPLFGASVINNIFFNEAGAAAPPFDEECNEYKCKQRDKCPNGNTPGKCYFCSKGGIGMTIVVGCFPIHQ